VGFAVAVVLGILAASADPRSGVAAAVVVGLAGGLAGIGTLFLLLRAAASRAEPERTDVIRGAAARTAGTGRRSFLGIAVGAALVAALTGAGGRLLVTRERVAAIRSGIRIPRPARTAPAPPPAASLEIPGITPLYVPNEEFYRIDTALTVPQVDPEGWTLQVGGMVDRPFTLTYDELLEMPHLEADITLACVSNPVGGDLVGNARWQGVPLRALLERAGVQEGATQLVGRSVDGFTVGFPVVTALALDDALVAVAMNGEPLPAEHGFPARLVVPGLFGYVSATKWLSEIELTTWESFDAYWIPRGWAKEGPVVTQSRIDVPASSARISAGEHPIAGVAWAPTRGIERVEVRVDDGPWVEAELAASLDIDCWRQWVYSWDATPGRHTISVRATDDVDTQTPVVAPVAPSGATGHHTITVEVG
jgi:DMSO/TMAO reductase YedYZ molybdopterin-dependent catalytic subunit